MSFKNLSWPEVVDSTYSKISSIVKNEEKFKQWMLTKEEIGRPFDAVLTSIAYKSYLLLKRENDKVVVIVGDEGSGKSTLAAQLCAFIDPEFTEDSITIGELQFIRALRRGKIGSAISVDEGGLAMFSREAMTHTNRSMVKIFMTIRRKALFVVICCPSYANLDSYIRNHRASLLLHITKRGHYTGFFGKAIEKINREIGRMKSISAIKCPSEFFWYGYYNKGFPGTLDYDSYLENKDSHIDSQLEQMEVDAEEREAIHTPKYKLSSRVGTELGLSPAQMLRRINKGTINAKKIGSRWFISLKERHRLGIS